MQIFMDYYAKLVFIETLTLIYLKLFKYLKINKNKKKMLKISMLKKMKQVLNEYYSNNFYSKILQIKKYCESDLK